MKIIDNRNKKEANIGDIIITDKGNKYMLLINGNETYPMSILNIEKDTVEFNTMQNVFVVGGTLISENIVEIISKNKIKLVIEK